MKVITDIKDATAKGLQVDKRKLAELDRKAREKNRPKPPPEDKHLKAIAEAVGQLKKAVDNNNSLIESNSRLIESAIAVLSALPQAIEKEPQQVDWSKIDVGSITRGMDGKITGVELKKVG